MAEETFPDRLREAITYAGVGRPEFAQVIGVTQSAVGHWLSARRSPDIDMLAKIAQFLGVRAAWLAFGDGPMIKATPRKISTTTPAVRAAS